MEWTEVDRELEWTVYQIECPCEPKWIMDRNRLKTEADWSGPWTAVNQSGPLTGVGQQPEWSVSEVYWTLDWIGL